MDFIQNSIKTLDFFGPKINFTIRGGQNFKTVLGGFISLIVCCLYVFFFILFGSDMIFKLNPNVTLETLMPEQQESFSLLNETFIAFTFENDSGEFIDTSHIFSIYPFFEEFDNTKKKTIFLKRIKISNCNESKYKPFFANSIYNASVFKCLDLAELENKTLFGSRSSKTFTQIFFELDICQLNLDQKKANCADYQKVEEFLYEKNLFISVLYNEVVFRQNNYTFPLELRPVRYLNKINMNLQKADVIFFQKTMLHQDDGFLFSNERVHTVMYGISQIDNFSNYRTEEQIKKYYSSDEYDYNKNLYTMIIRYDNAYKKYFRKYMKVQDVFGNVNGFMEFVILVFSLINFYTEYRFDYFLFNNIVFVKDDRNFKNNLNNLNNTSNHLNKNKFDILDGKLKKEELRIKNDNCGNNGDFIKSFYSKNNLDFTNRSESKLQKEEDHEANNNNNKNHNIFHVNNSYNYDKRDIGDLEIECYSFTEVNNRTQIKNLFTKNTDKEKKDFVKNRNQEQIEFSDLKEFKDLRTKRNIGNKTSNLCLDDLYNNNKRLRYLNPNCYYYFVVRILLKFNCYKDRNEKRSIFKLKFMEYYTEKINKRFDAFYYLKILRGFKNLKRLFLKQKDKKAVFNLLSEKLIEVNLNDFSIGNEETIFERKSKDKKSLVAEWFKNHEHREKDSFDDFVLDRL